jgi:hypothetical protein
LLAQRTTNRRAWWLRAIVGRFVWVVVALSTSPACDHPDPSFLSSERVARDPSGFGLAPALAGHTLDSHASFDAFEAELDSRGGESRAVAVYEALAARYPGDVLLKARWALALLEFGGQDRVSKVIPIVESLRALAPNSPDVIFVLGSVKRIIFFDEVSGSFYVPPDQLEIANALVADWKRMVNDHAAWTGPRGVSVAEIQRQLSALELAVEAARTKSPPTEALPELSSDAAARAAALGAFYLAYQNEPAEAACKAGRKALRLGASDVDPDVSQRVDAVCLRAKAK